MIIWIITIGEPILSNKSDLRLHRHGLLAKYLSENSSFKVIWWTSSFNHFTKEFEYEEDTDLNVNKNLQIKCLKGYGYNNNISLSRYYDHYLIQKKFSNKIIHEVKPDIIITSYPTLGLCEESVKYANKKSIPVLIDYRDLWPEVFYDLFPKKIRFIGKVLFSPLSKRLNSMFKKATGIIGITEEFLNIGLKRIKRNKNNFDSYFPLGYNKLELDKTQLRDQLNYWKSLGVKSDDGYIKFCFFGTLGHQYNLESLIQAFNHLNYEKIKLIICGSGDKESQLKSLAKNKNIIFSGYMNSMQLNSLMKISDFGVCPYLAKKMFLNSMPGKSIEYMSEGLSIINSLEGGILGDFVIKKGFGVNYDPSNINSLIDRLKYIINNIDDFRSKKLEIISFYNSNFDQSVVYKKYLNHIKKVQRNFNLT